MKIVWYWKNIVKAWCVVIISGVLFSLIPIQESISSLLGVIVGFAVMSFSILKWELWSFE